jgi:hypothetical protein
MTIVQAYQNSQDREFFTSLHHGLRRLEIDVVKSSSQKSQSPWITDRFGVCTVLPRMRSLEAAAMDSEGCRRETRLNCGRLARLRF